MSTILKEINSRLGDATFKEGDPEYDFWYKHLTTSLAREGKTLEDIIPKAEELLKVIIYMRKK